MSLKTRLKKDFDKARISLKKLSLHDFGVNQLPVQQPMSGLKIVPGTDSMRSQLFRYIINPGRVEGRPKR